MGRRRERTVKPPIEPPNRLEVLQSLRIANVDIAFATAFATLVTGAFIVGFIQSLGGKDMWIGLVSAIPSLAGLVQIPGAIWGRGFPSYKGFILPGALLGRLLYVPLVFLPFLPIPAELKLSLVAFCVLAASLSSMTVNSIYNDWLAEMVPADSRGFFFAKRNAIAAAVGAVVGLVGAVLLDWFRSNGEERTGFALVFGIALVCAALSLTMFMRMRDVPRTSPVRESLLSGIKAIGHPFRDPAFRRVLVFLSLFTAGQVFAGNLFAAFALESLELDFKIIQGAAVTFAVGNVLSARFWGFLSDKYGNKPMLMLAGTALALNPVPWIICIPGRDLYNALVLLIAHIFMGAIWGGVALCQFNLMLATAKPEDRANYIGAGLTTTALTGGVAPLLGASLMSALRLPFDPATAYKIVFTSVIGIRIFSIFFLLRVHEPGAATVRETLSSLRRVNPRGMRAMRNLRTATGEERAEAIQEVGSSGVSLASDAIIKALHDPLPTVRRRAAMAIARLHDSRAADELVHQIDEHPDLLEEETIEALGILGNPATVPALVKVLRHPSALIRRAAAKAIGRIATHGDEATVEALIQAASDPNDPDLRRSALQALRMMGATQATMVFRQALHDPLPSVRIAAAEAVSELQLSDAAHDVRTSLRSYSDEACSEVAYALGAVGTIDDLPMILQEANESRSMITRRRCLLGVARLLGVEQVAYRLLLQEGMQQDTALSEMLAQTMRRNPKVRVALDRFAQGDDAGALEALARASNKEELAILAAHPAPELFLVAASYVAQTKS